MITNRDIYTELAWMEKVCDGLKEDIKKATLKSQILQIKLLSNIRTNLVTTMIHLNVPMNKKNESQKS